MARVVAGGSRAAADRHHDRGSSRELVGTVPGRRNDGELPGSSAAALGCSAGARLRVQGPDRPSEARRPGRGDPRSSKRRSARSCRRRQSRRGGRRLAGGRRGDGVAAGSRVPAPRCSTALQAPGLGHRGRLTGGVGRGGAVATSPIDLVRRSVVMLSWIAAGARYPLARLVRAGRRAGRGRKARLGSPAGRCRTRGCRAPGRRELPRLDTLERARARLLVTALAPLGTLLPPLVEIPVQGIAQSGRRLGRLPDRGFATAFRIVLTLLALGLVREAVDGLLRPERGLSSGGRGRAMLRAWPSLPATSHPSP